MLEFARPPFFSDPGLTAVLQALPESRIVGGAVRDALLARRPGDVDLATPRTPDQVTAALEAWGIRALPTGLSHGTVTALVARRSFEITTLRRDLETDGRHASVAFTESWRADAARRDFTLNALSLRRDGAVFDYFGGLADLIRGRLRFVGDPAQRLAEDRLRTLRFFRFQARYAREAPDPATEAALRAAAPDLGALSAERVWAELKRLFAAPDPRPALRTMRRIGVLEAVLPEAGDLGPLDRLAALGAPPDPLLRLAALLERGTEALAERLHLAGVEAARLDGLLSDPIPRADADEAALRRLLADTPADLLIGRSLLAGIGGSAGGRLRARLSTLPPPRFPLAGRDVLALGVPPGPPVGALLREVRAWWLGGGCVADAAACRAKALQALEAATGAPLLRPHQD